MVVSGAPVKENDHADRVCDMALDMVEAITDLKDRSTGINKKKIVDSFFETHIVGIHSFVEILIDCYSYLISLNFLILYIY